MATTVRVSEARERLLRRAGELFYTEGIQSVGIDRLVADAQVTRATLYRHFPSKDDLVVAYLRQADTFIRAEIEGVLAGTLTPADQARAIATSIAGQLGRPGFRGCAFLNAATEYPDPAHPVHRLVLEHRAWFLDALTRLFARLSARSSEPIARHFVMLRDGAMTAGCLADASEVGATFLAGVEGLLASVTTPKTR